MIGREVYIPFLVLGNLLSAKLVNLLLFTLNYLSVSCG